MVLSGIELSAGVLVGVNSPVDPKYGTFADTATAISEITASLRYQGLTVGVIESGSVVEYWWKDGTDDGDLVAKTSGSGSTSILGAFVDLAFDNSGTSLPSSTATTIDSITVTDGMTVLVLDSSTAGEIGRVWTASVSGSTITWTVVARLGSEGGVEGQIAYITNGATGGNITAYKTATYTYSGSVWTKTTQAKLNAPIAEIVWMGEPVITANGILYKKKKFLVVDYVFATTAAYDAYVPSAQPLDSYLNLETGIASFSLQLGTNLSPIVIDVEDESYVIFHPTDTKFYQYNGTDAVEEVVLSNSTNIEIDNSSFDVITSPSPITVQEYAAQNDAALLKARGTEVLSGGAVTIASGTTFDVASTVGQIKDSTGYYAINYAGTTGVTVISTAFSSLYVYIDNAGALQQQSTEPTRDEFRSKLFLTRLAFSSSVLTAQESLINPSGNYTNLLRDYLSYVASPKKGLGLSANTDLTFQVAAGSIFELGTNFTNDVDNPSEISFLAQEPTTFFYVNRDTTLATGQTLLNVTEYDNAGTQTTMTNNRFKIMVVYKFNSGNHVIQEGQAQYSSLDEAQSAISSRNFVLNPILNNGTRLGWIIIQKDTTATDDTADCRFVNDEGSFSSTTATTGALLASNNLSDVLDATTSRGNIGAIADIVEDTTPQLGGSLDTQGNAITGNYPTDGRRAIIRETTTTRTFALSDAGGMVLFENASASTGTIPTNVSVAFPTGTEIDIVWFGAGEVTIEGDTGVTLNGVSAGSTTLTAQYGGATIKKIETDTWFIAGKINDVA